MIRHRSWSKRVARTLAMALGLALLFGAVGGVAYAAFSSVDSNAGNSLSAAADWTPPSVPSSVIAKNSPGYLGGFIHQGGNYRVYANVTDTGNPSSGVATVTADVSNISTGQNALALTSTGGPFTVQGVSYNYRSGGTLADSPLAAGSHSYSITATDGAGNSNRQGGFSVTVDNTAPSANAIATANVGGGTAGRAELGDSVTFTYTEQIDPTSILNGWTGASTSVVVRINSSGASDTLQVWDATNGAQLPLGQIALGANYVAASRTFGLTGTPSTMVQTAGAIKVTLGTPSGGTKTVPAGSTITWTPSTAPDDAAGNFVTATTTPTNTGMQF